jgi:hypothetical protein
VNLLLTIEAIAWVDELAFELEEANPRLLDTVRRIKTRVDVAEAHALACYSRDVAGREAPLFSEFAEMAHYVGMTVANGAVCERCGEEMSCPFYRGEYASCGDCLGGRGDDYGPTLREHYQAAFGEVR